MSFKRQPQGPFQSGKRNWMGQTTGRFKKNFYSFFYQKNQIITVLVIYYYICFWDEGSEHITYFLEEQYIYVE